MRPPPLIVLEECSPEVVAQVRAEVVPAGWRLVEGFGETGSGIVCTGRVEDADAAQRAVLAAVAGAGLIVEATAAREVLDRLCDDLRHLGSLDHRVGEVAEGERLSAEERALLELLLAGASLGEAARQLHVSRRTAERRLAAARRALGVTTSSQAVVLARRMGLGPAPT